jgi:hypothetical protein
MEMALDQKRPLSFISSRVDFVKRNLPGIIRVGGETGMRCRYASGFMPNSVKVGIQIVVY